ncbi:unnamed protein product [Heterobilharzia americana]|nr:unnamed protein product [Heterobilharzia americana]
MFRLTHYISEALFREQVLDTKLESVRQLLQETQDVSEAGWQAMVNEERLLEKLNLYETQLSLLKQDLPEDSLQSHLVQVLEEKFNLEKASKMMLERLLNEKTEVFSKATDLEHSLTDSQKECIHLRKKYESIQEAYQNLANERQSKLLACENSEKQIKEDEAEKPCPVKTDYIQFEKVWELAEESFKRAIEAKQNFLMNGLGNGVLKTHENHDEKLNDVEQQSAIENNIDQTELFESDYLSESQEKLNDIEQQSAIENNIDQAELSDLRNLCKVQGRFVSTGEEYHHSNTNEEILDCIQSIHHCSQSIKSIQNKLSILAEFKKSDSSILSTPVNSDPIKMKTDSYQSNDSVNCSVNSERKYDANDCKKQTFEASSQRATEYAALILKFLSHFREHLCSLFALHNESDDSDPLHTFDDICVLPDDLVTTHINKRDVSTETEAYDNQNQLTEVVIDELTNLKVVVDHSETPNFYKNSNTGELSKLRDELSKSAKEIEAYKQLTDDLRNQDSAKAELLLIVREECDALRRRITVIETDVATSRADHHRLVSEARRAQAEADELIRERDKLSDQLVAANRQVEHLQGLLATTLLGESKHSSNSNKKNETSVADSASQTIALVNQYSVSSSPRISHVPLHEHCFSLFAVIPIMVLICAFMAYIFLKFVQ